MPAPNAASKGKNCAGLQIGCLLETSAEQGTNASKRAAYNTYVVPSQRLSDGGGNLFSINRQQPSHALDDECQAECCAGAVTNATSEPMPADSHHVKRVQIAPEELNLSPRIPEACNTLGQALLAG